MEPLGTIVKYYPFIDEDTKSILNSVMEESSRYYDFVQTIAEVVLEKESAENLVYIAAAQCWYAGISELRIAILEKYSSLATIKPWRYYWGTHESFKFENCQVILQSLDTALESSKDSWIATELLLSHAYNLAVRPEGTQLLSKANAILDQHPDLLCFKPLAYIAEGTMNYVEGKISDATKFAREGYDLAKANNDTVYELFAILNLGESTKHKNPQESLDLFEQAYQIAQDLGGPVFTGETMASVGLAYEVLGEYDLAISAQLECLNKVGIPGNELIFGILSRLYATLGEGLQALEWADRSLEDKEFHVGYLRKARALIVLNRLDEAEKVLNVASRKILQAGYEDHLALYHFVSGLLDMARGEFANAMVALEQAYVILYPLERLGYLNEVLISLARAELALFMRFQSRNEAVQGKWLPILENHARTFDMPGIAMRAALLRSEVFMSQGQLQDAYETLRRALELTDSPGVKTVRKRITTRMKEIEHQLHDEEMSS